jgi:membrane protease YdiL (CAAX protease family)
MSSLKHFFWNTKEHRLRAFWRLLIQGVMLLVFMLGFQLVFSVVGFAILAGQGNINPDLFTTPGNLEQFIYQNQFILFLTLLGTGLAMTLSVWLAGMILDRRNFKEFGFRLNKSWWTDFGFGLALGAFLMLLIFLAELSAGWVEVTGFLVTRNPDQAFLIAILPPFGIFLFVGFYEELLFRGYQLTNLAEGLSGKLLSKQGAILLATFISSAVFGILHATNPNANLTSTINIGIAGIFLATGFLLTGELAIPIGLHITWNLFQGNVFGFPVSGGAYNSATLIAINQLGPTNWTGGPFGPEAGYIGLIGIALGILATIAWVKFRYGKIEIHLGLADAPRANSPQPVDNDTPLNEQLN